MKELFSVLTAKEALAVLNRNWSPPPPGVEMVPLGEGLGRVTARDIAAPEDIPGFNRATVDGLALQARDTFGASEGMPAYLAVVGEIAMGQCPRRQLVPGEAMRIATGGMLPAGSDAVVMVEHTEDLDDAMTGVVRPVAPGENVIYKGEDVTAGEMLLPRGRRLRAVDLGVLAAGGTVTVPVVPRPRVAVISTGDELVEPHRKPAPGQIRDINTYTLGAKVEEAGGRVIYRQVLGDHYDALYSHLIQALAEADIVVLSGGTSVGSRDLTEEVINASGSPGVLVHGVAIKPGKPTIIGLSRGKPVFGLSGNPVSALITFDLFVLPALARLQGMPDPVYRASVRARLSRNLASAPGREDFFRVKLNSTAQGLAAEPVLGKTGLIATMARAEGLVHIPLTKEGLAAGEEVDVWLF